MNIIDYYSEIEKIVEKNAMIDVFGVGTFEEQFFTFNKLGLWLLKADKPGEDTYTVECLIVGSAAQKAQSIENYERNFGIVLSTARNAVDSLRRSLEKNNKIGSVLFSPLVVENETYGTGIVGYSFEMKLRLPRPKFKPTVKKKANSLPTYALDSPMNLQSGFSQFNFYNSDFSESVIVDQVSQDQAVIKSRIEQVLTESDIEFSSVTVVVTPIDNSTQVELTTLIFHNTSFPFAFHLSPTGTFSEQ